VPNRRSLNSLQPRKVINGLSLRLSYRQERQDSTSPSNTPDARYISQDMPKSHW